MNFQYVNREYSKYVNIVKLSDHMEEICILINLNV